MTCASCARIYAQSPVTGSGYCNDHGFRRYDDPVCDLFVQTTRKPLDTINRSSITSYTTRRSTRSITAMSRFTITINTDDPEELAEFAAALAGVGVEVDTGNQNEAAQPAPAKKGRRTKAEIEADKAAPTATTEEVAAEPADAAAASFFTAAEPEPALTKDALAALISSKMGASTPQAVLAQILEVCPGVKGIADIPADKYQAVADKLNAA